MRSSVPLDSIWAEDGFTWLSDAMHHGFLIALTTTYDGYLQTVSRLVAHLVVALPVAAFAPAMALAGAVIVTVCAFVVWSSSSGSRSDWRWSSSRTPTRRANLFAMPHWDWGLLPAYAQRVIGGAIAIKPGTGPPRRDDIARHVSGLRVRARQRVAVATRNLRQRWLPLRSSPHATPGERALRLARWPLSAPSASKLG